MNKTIGRTLIVGIALVSILGGLALADTVRPRTPAARILTPEPPLRIVRRPPIMKLTPRPVTNHVWPRSEYQGFLTGVVIFPPVAHAAPPSKHALIIILENGGAMKNVDADGHLKQALDVDYRSVSCGEWEFELRVGENIVGLLGRVGRLIVGNAGCLIPGNWHMTTFNPYHYLDEQSDVMLENAIKAQHSVINTQSHYDRVVVMEDADTTPARVLAMIRTLEPQFILDIHVLAHGGDNFFAGYHNASFDQTSFFGPLGAEHTAGRLYLRAVYQMNCSSGTLKDDWTALGAVAVNGTSGANLNSMPHQYFFFLQYWLNSPPGLEGMREATRRSFEDTAAIMRPIYTLAGQGAAVDQSKLTVSGSNPNVRVNSAH